MGKRQLSWVERGGDNEIREKMFSQKLERKETYYLGYCLTFSKGYRLLIPTSLIEQKLQINAQLDSKFDVNVTVQLGSRKTCIELK